MMENENAIFFIFFLLMKRTASFHYVACKQIKEEQKKIAEIMQMNFGSNSDQLMHHDKN